MTFCILDPRMNRSMPLSENQFPLLGGKINKFGRLVSEEASIFEIFHTRFMKLALANTHEPLISESQSQSQWQSEGLPPKADCHSRKEVSSVRPMLGSIGSASCFQSTISGQSIVNTF